MSKQKDTKTSVSVTYSRTTSKAKSPQTASKDSEAKTEKKSAKKGNEARQIEDHLKKLKKTFEKCKNKKISRKVSENVVTTISDALTAVKKLKDGQTSDDKIIDKLKKQCVELEQENKYLDDEKERVYMENESLGKKVRQLENDVKAVKGSLDNMEKMFEALVTLMKGNTYQMVKN